jgi:hypothetical protein
MRYEGVRDLHRMLRFRKKSPKYRKTELPFLASPLPHAAVRQKTVTRHRRTNVIAVERTEVLG